MHVPTTWSGKRGWKALGFSSAHWMGFRPWQRHSLVLSVAGFVYMAIGVSYYVLDPIPARLVALEVALAWMPFKGWGLVFIIVGLLTIISSRWPPISKSWGYIAMTGLSAGWAAFYLMSIIFGDSPLMNITAVLTWSLTSFLWWAISGLVNPDEGG